MQYRDLLVSTLPHLRRFAGALTAPGHVQACGAVDDLVTRAASLVVRERHDSEAAVRIALYSAVIRLAQNRDLRQSQTASAPTPPPPGSFADGLLSLQVQHRAALLLVTLEQLSYDEAAAILGVSRTFLVAKLSTARQMLARRLAASNDRPATHLRLVT